MSFAKLAVRLNFTGYNIPKAACGGHLAGSTTFGGYCCYKLKEKRGNVSVLSTY